MEQRYVPPPLGPYQYHEVLSALRKEIKLANQREAIYWTWVMIHYIEKGGIATVAKQLWIMAAEDIDDPEIVSRAYAVFQMASKVSESDHVIFLVAAMCRARKWWETEEGRSVDEDWSRAIGDLRSNQHPIPSYALDRHTRRGWDIFKKTGQFDDRFTGTDLGRQKTVYMYLRDGFIDAVSEVFKFRDGTEDKGFFAWWRNVRERQKMTKGELEPNDPLGEDGTRETEDGLF